MTTITEQTETALASTAAAEPKATKKPRAARRANVARKKPKSGKKAAPRKKAPKSPKKATGARDGGKAAKILELLKRPDDATSKELQKASGWQPHSVPASCRGPSARKWG
jgi:hypothetical protein